MIFLHIHRTGGSTLWHTLSNAAISQNHQAIDLYYESWAAFKNPFSTVNAIEKMIADGRGASWDSDSLFIHHHTRQNIENSLPREALCYATIIRDPVDRFISEVFHIRKLLMHGAELAEDFPFYEGEFGWYRNVLGESLYHLFIQENVDPDELLVAASKCPYYKNFYFNIFWSVLISDQNTINPTYFTGNITDSQRHVLVTVIREKFVYIGRYPQLKSAISSIAYFKGISIDPDANLIHVKNASTKPEIRPETLDKIRKANEDEYLFLSMLEAPSARELILERIEREEQSKQEIIRQNIEHSQIEIKNLQQALRDTVDELRISQNFAEKMRMELNQAQNHIEQLHHSKSWRMTAPLRSIIRLIRRL